MAIYMWRGIPVTGVTLDKSSITLTTVGQTEQLTATVSPNDAEDKSVTWTTSNSSIATVDQTGLVTCVTPGSCTITATINGFSDTCSVQSLLTTIDYTTDLYDNDNANTSYYYGMKFTALKSGSIKEVGLLYPGTTVGTMKIAQGNYASANGTTYTLNTYNTGGAKYVLDTPYQITAGNNYVVSFISYNNTGLWGVKYPAAIPVIRTAVQYDYATLSNTTVTYTGRVRFLKSLTIEYTP